MNLPKVEFIGNTKELPRDYYGVATGLLRIFLTQVASLGTSAVHGHARRPPKLLYETSTEGAAGVAPPCATLSTL